MRRSFALAVLLATVAACGGPSGSGQEQGAPAPAADSSARAPGDTGPNVAPTAAPGVAFRYRYFFRLPAERITEVQEQHAAMCEQLGPDRCRITGLHYEKLSEYDVRGRLDLALEPGIARRVGREGIAAVIRADGSLVESEISGADVGSGIRQAGRSIEQMGEELRRIEARLATRGLGAEERGRLEYEAQKLRDEMRGAEGRRAEAQQSLATTPLVFHYGSGNLAPGSDARPSFGRVLEDAGDNFLDGATMLFILLVTLAPWALAAGLLWWLVRWARRRFVKPKPAAETKAA